MDIGSLFASLSPSQKGALLGGLAGTGLGAAAGGMGSKNNKLKSSLIGGLTGGLGGAGLGAGIGAGVAQFSGMNSKPKAGPDAGEDMSQAVNYHAKLLKAPENTPTGNFNAIIGGAGLTQSPKMIDLLKSQLNSGKKTINSILDEVANLKKMMAEAVRKEKNQQAFRKNNREGQFGGFLPMPKQK